MCPGQAWFIKLCNVLLHWGQIEKARFVIPHSCTNKTQMNAHTYAAETRIHQSLKAHSYLKLEGIEVKRKKMERIKRSILTDVLLDIRLQRRSVSLYLKCVSALYAISLKTGKIMFSFHLWQVRYCHDWDLWSIWYLFKRKTWMEEKGEERRRDRREKNKRLNKQPHSIQLFIFFVKHLS